MVVRITRLLLLIGLLALVATACTGQTIVERGTLTPADEAESTSDAEANADAISPTPGAGEPKPALGTAEQVSSLRDSCEEGSDQACDLLYQLAPFDSDEEEIALDCGGRRGNNDSPFCTEGISFEQGTLWFRESSPGLPGIVDACESGDMTACDFLFFRAPIGSTYEQLGTTCGDRTTVAVPDCRTAIGLTTPD